jgi:hypothetical protein
VNRLAVRRLSVALILSLAGASVLFFSLDRGIPRAYDLPDHLGAMQQVLVQMAHGDLYPRWQPDTNDGWGEPTLVFYPPALYLLGAAGAWLVGGDTVGGLYGLLALMTVAGGIGMWLWVGREFGRVAGGIAVLAWGLAPYRFFEVYCGGLYSAFAAGCVFPWVLMSLTDLAVAQAPGDRARALLLYAVGLGVLVLFNLPAAILFGYLLAIWLLVELFATHNLRLIGDAAIGGAWGGLLAAIYLLPASRLLHAIVIPLSLGPPVFRSNFVFQGRGSAWSPGVQSLFDRMGLFPALGLLVAVLVLWSAARDEAGPATRRRAVWRRQVASLGLASLLLAIPVSGPLWEMLPLLQRANLPWRLLAPLGLAAAAAFSAAVPTAGLRLWSAPAFSRAVAGVVLVFFLALVLLIAFFDRSIAFVNGRIPAASIRASVPLFARKPGYFVIRGSRPAAEVASRPPVSCSDSCRLAVREWSPTVRRFDVETATAAVVTLRTYDFPGWSASTDDQPPRPLPVFADPASGAVSVHVPSGRTRVRVVFGSIGIVRLATLVSAIALLAATLGLFLIRRRARGTPLPTG